MKDFRDGAAIAALLSRVASGIFGAVSGNAWHN